ncbi:MAG: YeeE/YedE family protein [Halioglobus sp.]|jgi:uncharacterized membrane protein YedE/YeeE|nr:YeeE/YedE family protein [Halioglobus sp.]
MLAYTTPLIGGLLIGVSAVALLALLGRIAGIAGIVWGAVSAQPDNAWRWLFIVGLLIGPVLYHSLTGAPQPQASSLPWWQAVAGGLLVGFGVKLGSGCTSGHGVCGIGRLSPRSVAATITFMATGIITVYVIRHLLGAA